MNVDLIFQIAGVGIIVAVLNQLLTRAGRTSFAYNDSRTCGSTFYTVTANRRFV